MKVWTVILAGVVLAALPNLGNSALEDAGVYMSIDYTDFQGRVIPAKTPLICTNNYNEYEWFEINKFEQLLLDFENGNNTMTATIRLGTPVILVAMVTPNEFSQAIYCKYLPKAFHTETGLRGKKAQFVMQSTPWNYYAVKINDMERATILQGWNSYLNVVKARFPNNNPVNYLIMILEKTAAGEIYIGSFQYVK